MKQKNTLISLTVKVLGAIAFLALFIFNIVLFVKKDSKTGDLSINTPQAKANEASEDYYESEYEMIAGEGIDLEPDDSTEGTGISSNKHLVQVRCLKVGFTFNWPVLKSQVTVGLGYRMKCKPAQGETCDATKQTGCS